MRGFKTALPLPADVASDPGRFVALNAADAPVFPLPDKGFNMLKVDPAAAGMPPAACSTSTRSGASARPR